MWGRFLLMLQLTKSFGPMLRIILNMVGEVLRFLLVWTVVLVTLTSVSSLIFGEVNAYSDGVQVLFKMFGTGVASFNMTEFEDLSLGAAVG